MPNLEISDIGDLVTTTLDELGKFKWTQIAVDEQEHYALPHMMKKERVGFQAGEQISFNVMHKHSGAANFQGMYHVDSRNNDDVMATGRVPWRHVNTHYMFDRVELKINRTPARIVDLVKTKRADAMISLSALMEESFWDKPNSATDTLSPFGIDYWIVNNNTTGFNGGDPSAVPTTGAASLAVATYARWKNWTAQYVNFTRDDLVRKMRKCYREIQFKPPVSNPSYNSGDRYQLYTNGDVIERLEELAENQNDRLGRDIASMDGRTTFRRAPINYVPFLDDDTNLTDPIYFINWGVFKPVFLTGEYLVETRDAVGNQHKVTVIDVDMTFNWICFNRRRLGVINK